MISIIIRSKNEERWIGQCLKKIKMQTYKDYEVILVDNSSSDFTVEKAKSYFPDIKVCNIDEFKPGKALNQGIAMCSGEFVVCLSAHCIPVDELWLESLFKEITADEETAGVYGRQLPMDQTHDIDRRDLYITFGLDRRVQHKDPFFHNANSIIKKSLWEKVPFDSTEENLEDRIWGQAMINAGHKLVYTPSAEVYHLHGIHQTNQNKRYKNISRLIEQTSSVIKSIPIEEYSVCAILPIRRSELEVELSREVFVRTLGILKSIEYVSTVVVTIDDAQCLSDVLLTHGVEEEKILVHQRVSENERMLDVYPVVLNFLKNNGIFPDIVLTSDISYPMKSKTIFEKCLFELLKNDVDAVIPAYAQNRPTWIRGDGDYVRIDDYESEKETRDHVYVALESLCTATYSDKLTGYRDFFDNRIEMMVLESPFYQFKIADVKDLAMFDLLDSNMEC